VANGVVRLRCWGRGDGDGRSSEFDFRGHLVIGCSQFQNEHVRWIYDRKS
jgi:hypothetical protein